MKITIVTASEGKNLEHALKIKEYLAQKSVESNIIDIAKLDFPLFTSTSETKYEAKKVVSPILEDINANGYFFLAPEYNGGLPPTFTNFLAWISRSTSDWRATFNGKPAAIGSHSAGGGSLVLSIMRLQLSYIGLNIVGRQLHTTLNRPDDQASLVAICDQLIKLCKMDSLYTLQNPPHKES